MHLSPSRSVLVVDGANVVGSVPDGWWRDRPGAAARLHAGLVEAAETGNLGYAEAVLVLEGRACSGVPSGPPGPADQGAPGARVRTVHAPGSGDDEIVAQCRDLAAEGAAVTLATADRGLIARVRHLGVAIVGPRTIRRSR